MNDQHGNEIEYYKIAVDLIIYEGQRLWQVFHLYLIAQVILLGSLIGTERLDLDISIVIGIAGLLLCIPWAGAYFRHSQWYIYRIEDAKEIENENNLKRKFFTKKRDFGVFERIFRPMNLIGLLIAGISFFYLFFLYKSNMPCFCLYIFMLIPLSILCYHFYLIGQWKKNEEEGEEETQSNA